MDLLTMQLFFGENYRVMVLIENNKKIRVKVAEKLRVKFDQIEADFGEFVPFSAKLAQNCLFS